MNDSPSANAMAAQTADGAATQMVRPAGSIVMAGAPGAVAAMAGAAGAVAAGLAEAAKMGAPGGYDVIIVGAGPGGSSTAAYCGRAGLKVLLLDKAGFPRDKTCGDALSGKSMGVIRELGLVGEIEKMPHGTISGVLFSAPDGKAVSIPFHKSDPNRPGGSGYCMRRLHTDFMLFNAARKTPGVTIMEKFQVNEVVMDEQKKVVGIKGLDLADPRRGERIFNAKVVVGADGVNSAVVRAVLGEKGALPPQHSCDALRVYYEGITGMTNDIEIHFMASCMPGYFWIFPLDDGKANVGIGLITKDLNERMAKEKITLIGLLNNAIANEPIIKERFANAKAMGPITGWRLPFGSFRRQLAGEGWVLVGDAACLVDPFSGEGVGNATVSGKLAAQTISEAVKMGDLSRAKLAEYEKAVWAELGPELDTSYKMQQLGKQQWLLNMVVDKASSKPEIRDLISSSLANEEAKKNFKNPLFYLNLLLT